MPEKIIKKHLDTAIGEPAPNARDTAAGPEVRLESFKVGCRYDNKKELTFVIAGGSEDMAWTMNLLTDFLRQRFQWQPGGKHDD